MAQTETGRGSPLTATLTKFLKFIAASGAATALDLLLFYLLKKWAVPALWPQGVGAIPPLIPDTGILFATVAARICSASVNFLLNKNFVFRLKGQKHSLLRYAILCVCVMILDAVFVGQITRLLPPDTSAFLVTLIKAGVDVLLFIGNFFIQKVWVFPQTQETEE